MSIAIPLLAAMLIQPAEPASSQPAPGVTSTAPAIDARPDPEVTEPPPPAPTAPARGATESAPPLAQPAVAPTPTQEPEFDRRGFTLRAAIGIANCFGDFCDDDEDRVKTGLGALFELGHRPIEHISFGAGINIARMEIDVDTGPGYDVDASALMVSPLACFFVHPVKSKRLDPYAGVSLGWQLHRSTYESSSDADSEFDSGDDEYTFSLKRSTARLTGGLDVYIAQHVAIGPRFDLFLGFGGEACTDDGDDEECDDVDDAFDNEDEEDEEDEEELPRNWMFGLNLSATF